MIKLTWVAGLVLTSLMLNYMKPHFSSHYLPRTHVNPMLDGQGVLIMTYMNDEYAKMAIKANEEGKALKKVKGKLKLVEPQPIALTDEQIVSQNQTMKI